jgi:hypothetical protein
MTPVMCSVYEKRRSERALRRSVDTRKIANASESADHGMNHMFGGFHSLGRRICGLLLSFVRLFLFFCFGLGRSNWSMVWTPSVPLLPPSPLLSRVSSGRWVRPLSLDKCAATCDGELANLGWFDSGLYALMARDRRP